MSKKDAAIAAIIVDTDETQIQINEMVAILNASSGGKVMENLFTRLLAAYAANGLTPKCGRCNKPLVEMLDNDNPV